MGCVTAQLWDNIWNMMVKVVLLKLDSVLSFSLTVCVDVLVVSVKP